MVSSRQIVFRRDEAGFVPAGASAPGRVSARRDAIFHKRRRAGEGKPNALVPIINLQMLPRGRYSRQAPFEGRSLIERRCRAVAVLTS
jgi:hypothetical protein